MMDLNFIKNIVNFKTKHFIKYKGVFIMVTWAIFNLHNTWYDFVL